MHYYLRFSRFAEQLIEVHLQTYVSAGETTLHLPHWRPGRYELQNYARFLSDVQAVDGQGQCVPLCKTATHSWTVHVSAETELRVSYLFFANQTDAGGTYFDAEHILFNGITCLMYPAGSEAAPCTLELDLPRGFRLGGDLAGEGGASHAFDSVHDLLDTPWLAGPGLQHHSFAAGDLEVHLWFLGEAKPDFPRLEADLRRYTEVQLAFFGECPVARYHYLYLMLPQRYRHGVEHRASTVIVMGPGVRCMEDDFYKSLLEISSHEFFHTWNVKALRPADMLPYDYQRENYSELHYVTEGLTTYYGDLMLWKAHNWDLDQWLGSINGELARHYQTGAQDHTSLVEASFDSWVNGYRNDGTPNRRISFYTKGYLVALLLDTELRRLSDHQVSLDTVITELYHGMRTAQRGYTRADFIGIVEAQSGKDFTGFFADYIEGTRDLLPALQDLGCFYGFSCLEVAPTSPSLARWGLRSKVNEQGLLTVEQLYAHSPLVAAGVNPGAELLAIEGQRIMGNLDDWLTHYAEQDRWRLHYFYFGQLRETEVYAPGHTYRVPQFVAQGPGLMEEQQRRNLASWQALVPPVRPGQPPHPRSSPSTL